MKAISVSALLFASQFAILSSVQAQTSSLWGSVNMNGSIVDSACAIDTGSYEQVVDMGILPIGTIRQQGQSPIRPFSITLIGCTLMPYTGSAWQAFTVTFDGPTSGNWFTVSGDAHGVALSLQDADGQLIYPGRFTKKQTIKPENMVLHYGLRLVSDNQPLRPGEYQSALRFKLDYY
ncbi:fimbrial protein [Providencia heimbachae]|uniref:MrfB family protein n=1 Tax=Providencia heimbachae ATCC 35613 TaxID=1354272 RepID=A0A1B7JTV3_9GAMM|nr:fimbrial protein [Providencia heimbachae]OAT51337.1 MrfB family protein [Providencia heimbachae ATCC 35613]SQH11499.1 PAP fimbrial minor pilin protein precursor [Providencia heimbachae]